MALRYQISAVSGIYVENGDIPAEQYKREHAHKKILSPPYGSPNSLLILRSQTFRHQLFSGNRLFSGVKQQFLRAELW